MGQIQQLQIKNLRRNLQTQSGTLFNKILHPLSRQSVTTEYYAERMLRLHLSPYPNFFRIWIFHRK